MIVRRFKWGTDEVGHGLWGWLPAWMPGDTILPVNSPAHDVLEHMGTDRPTIEQEMMAFGEMAWCRMQHNWWHHHGRSLLVPTDEMWTSDFDEFFHREDAGVGRLISDVPENGAGHLRDSNMEDLIRTATRKAVKYTNKQIHEDWSDVDYGTPEGFIDREKEQLILGWIRAGVRRSMRRWPDSYGVGYMHRRIDNLVKEKSRPMDGDGHLDYMLTVRVSKNGTVEAQVDEPRYDDYGRLKW